MELSLEESIARPPWLKGGDDLQWRMKNQKKELGGNYFEFLIFIMRHGKLTGSQM